MRKLRVAVCVLFCLALISTASWAQQDGTISGKITELAVRDIVHGRAVKNRDALANPEALELFRDLPELRD